MTSDQPTRILVADGDARAREAVAEVLLAEGFEVLEATDGADAVELFQDARPDLVVLEAEMPKTSGLEACGSIRRMSGGEYLPILIVTGDRDPDVADRAFEAGASDFFRKPMPATVLRQRIRFLLRAHGLTEALIRSEVRLEAVQRIAHLGTWEFAGSSESVILSTQASSLLGLDAGAAEIGLDEFITRLDPDGSVTLANAIAAAREDGGGFHRGCCIRLPDGTQRSIHVEAGIMAGRDGALLLAGTIQDVTEREEAQDQIRMLAYYDSLTGLPNRTLFNETLQVAVARAQRQGTMLAVLFVDLDHFKRVNDTMGHSAGDRLLEIVARRLREVVRTEDILSRPELDAPSEVARLGGDEFILLAADLHLPEDAALVARRILEAFRTPVPLAGGEVFVSASVGISIFPQDGANDEQLLKNADAALYHAKDSGRNNYQFYSPRLNAAALERLTLERGLRVALERDEFVLHFQPQIASKESRIVGVEALVRWQHPELGLFTPSQFIGVAEETGLIQRIGDLVLRRACIQLKEWDAAGLPPVRMAVNISGRQFRDPGFLESVQAALRETGAPSGRLELEITESVLMDDASESTEILKVLESEGVRIAVDDFGSGYSSLSYLKRFPLHVLKIDREFIRDIASDPDNAAIVTAVIALARSLNLQVVAEGVETLAQRKYLQKRGCDLMQGYLFGKPVPTEEAETMIKARPPSTGAKRQPKARAEGRAVKKKTTRRRAS